jgi:predicted nucleic acid-binding protein
VKRIFLDTNVFVSGLLEVSADSACRAILEALETRRLRSCVTAWHCCLEFFSVTTRLPPEYRLSAEDAISLLAEHVFDRVRVEDLPAGEAVPWLKQLGDSEIRGGLVYDAHLARVAQRAGCALLVTSNVADFRQIAPAGIEVLNPRQFIQRMEGFR